MADATSKASEIPHGAILLFNTRAATHLAARLHGALCPLVAAARKSRPGRVQVIEGDDAVASEVADLVEREWPVKACKCLEGLR